MKFMCKLPGVLAVALSLGFAANGQQKAAPDTTFNVVRRLAMSKDASAKDSLLTMLDTLQNSALESHLVAARNGYYMLKQKAKSDSLNEQIKTKFPLGATVRDEEEEKVYKAVGAIAKEKAYYAWVKKFPPSHFPDVDHDHIVYDYARVGIAEAYADTGNVAKAKYWIAQCEEDFWKGNGYGGLSNVFEKQGKLALAAKYEKLAMESAGKYYAMKNPDNAGRFAASGYVSIMTHYTDLLMKQKRWAEAAVWANKAISLQKEPNPGLDFVYSKLLMRQKKYKEAYDRLAKDVEAGHGFPELLDSFKVAYEKVNGGLAGYDKYAASIHAIVAKNIHQQLLKEELNLPASDFTLTDVDGNVVSLADYRGKTIILDFWATWCGPCKASFPLMARTVEKYKSDTTVKFFFIHTWERDSTAALAAKNAKTFIESHHYPFEVLMDTKDAVTGENKVVTAYKVSGIPTKFVIDKAG
ncbi:MAG TPA: TlpA disulfide reductase family protein, partial [Puia sp.]|nr:TlpA disulfide reductase family protein [Puia sp.]